MVAAIALPWHMLRRGVLVSMPKGLIHSGAGLNSRSGDHIRFWVSGFVWFSKYRLGLASVAMACQGGRQKLFFNADSAFYYTPTIGPVSRARSSDASATLSAL
jgi:hypothetical protein